MEAFIATAEEYFKQHGALSRENFFKLIRQQKGSRIYFAERKIDHIDIDVFIMDKLKRGHERANIAKRVMGLTGCCASSAYNHINRAMEKMNAQKDLFSELV
jgi:hypothetical protein